MSDNKNKKYKNDLAKKIRKKGYIMVGYTFVKILGAVVAIVLERLITELYYAIGHEYTCDNKSFTTTIENLSFHLGFSNEEIIAAFEKLQSLNLINYKQYNQYHFVTLNEDDIVGFEIYSEYTNKYKNWDENLDSIQKIGKSGIDEIEWQLKINKFNSKW